MASMMTSLATFIGIVSIPKFAPQLISMMGFDGIFSGMIASYAVPFFMNLVINIFSDYMYLMNNCSGDKKLNVSFSSVVGTAIIPCFITLILGVVLNFLPFLKLPLFIFAIGGMSWIVDSIVNIIGNYLISSPISWPLRLKMFDNNCKKEEKEEKEE